MEDSKLDNRLKCPRCKDVIETPECLKKHILCEPCRNMMIKMNWITKNMNKILSVDKTFALSMIEEIEKRKGVNNVENQS